MSWQFYTDAGVIKSQGGGGGTINAIDDINDVDVTGAVDGSLLRYEATGTQWNDTSALLFTDAGQLQVTTLGAAGGLLLGGDVNFYRAAANVGRTDDDFAIGATSMYSFEVSGSRFALSDANIDHIDTGTNNYIQLRASADSQPRIRLGIGTGTGTTPGIALGPGGASATDVNLYRSAAATLSLTGSLAIGSGLTVTGSSTFNNTVNLNSLVNVTGASTVFEFTSANGPGLIRTGATGTAEAIRTKVTGDSGYRLRIRAGGDISWGDGTTYDISLSRTAADTLALATGDKLQSDVVAISGSDLTNQVYVDRLTFLMGA